MTSRSRAAIGRCADFSGCRSCNFLRTESDSNAPSVSSLPSIWRVNASPSRRIRRSSIYGAGALRSYLPRFMRLQRACIPLWIERHAVVGKAVFVLADRNTWGFSERLSGAELAERANSAGREIVASNSAAALGRPASFVEGRSFAPSLATAQRWLPRQTSARLA